MTSVKRHAEFGARAFLVLLLPVGFLTVSDIFQQDYWYDFALTIIAACCCWTILFLWKLPVRRYPHVYLFLTFYLIGYFIKFYVLAYLVLNGEIYWEYLDVYYRFERQILEDYWTVTLCYEISTIGLFCATLSVGVLKMFDKSDFANARGAAVERLGFNVSSQLIRSALVFTVVLFVLLLSIQMWLGLGFVSGAERQQVQLPFRLAGIIVVIYRVVLPLLFLTLLWISDQRNENIWKWTLTVFIVYGLASGLHSTSKAFFATVIILVGLLWIITNRLSLRRFALLVGLIVFMLPFNTLLGVNRVLRVLRDDVDIFELAGLAWAVIYDSKTSQEYVGIFHSDLTRSLAEILGPVMRINGADALLNIANFGPTFSVPRVVYYLFESESAVNIEYATRVLGLPVESGLAFSPSLMGYLYFILGDAVLSGLALMVFLLFWNTIFVLLNHSGFKLRPVIFAVLLISFVHYLSEGTLESMPMNIAIILTIGTVFEIGLRLVSPTIRTARVPSPVS